MYVRKKYIFVCIYVCMVINKLNQQTTRSLTYLHTYTHTTYKQHELRKEKNYKNKINSYKSKIKKKTVILI